MSARVHDFGRDWYGLFCFNTRDQIDEKQSDERPDVVATHVMKFRVVAIATTMGLAFAVLALASASPVGANAPFVARGSINQVSVTGLTPGASVELRDSGDQVVASDHKDWEPPAGVADSQGAYLFRRVPAGIGYRVRSESQSSNAVTVTDPGDTPDPTFYQQPNAPVLSQGFTYIPTRDGTTLSANITFPDEKAFPKPWPVLVDYSGYDPSKPGAAPAEAAVFPFQGYVVVGLNVRGTTCSGGAFDFFEELQNRDGYDAIEMLANQPWSNGDVGMVGISYMGISQLFVAQNNPPHLRAITPLSVIADTFRSTLYPGGILNTGFAVSWANERMDSAKPAAHGWVRTRIDEGDTVCAENQKLRLQSIDLLRKISDNPYYLADGGDELSPRTFVHKIKMPVYIGGAFQDEQTGGAWSSMLDQFDPDTTVRAFLTNGTHTEGLAAQNLVRLMEFVDFYVGRRIPRVEPLVRLGAPGILTSVFGGSPIPLPPDRFTGAASFGAALASYESEPAVRLVWETGAGLTPGEPQGTAESTFSAWPVPGTIDTSYYLQPGGGLADTASQVSDSDPNAWSSYRYDPSSKRASTFDGGSGDIFKAETQIGPDIHWEQLAAGDSTSFLTQPFTTKTAFAGEGAVDLWLRSSAADTDIEVTLTEVRPDGVEEYIQSGWLRASHRKLDLGQSTPMAPFHTDLAGDAESLPAGEFVPVEIALFPFAHVIRPGSRLRLNIEAPGGNQPLWKFETLPAAGNQVNDIGHSVARPSRIQLPQLPPDLMPNVPATVAPCPALRNQPCRVYVDAIAPTTTTTVTDASVAAATEDAGNSDGLPATGAMIAGLVLVALVLLIGGAGLVVLARKRKNLSD